MPRPKKATAVAAEEVKEKVEEPVKKPRAPRTPKAPVPAVFVEFGETKNSVAELVEKAKADFAQNSSDAVKDIQLYIKPEDGAAYYVINGVEGKVAL